MSWRQHNTGTGQAAPARPARTDGRLAGRQLAGRMPGWLAQWQEGAADPEQKISRPQQIYTGPGLRHLNGTVG